MVNHITIFGIHINLNPVAFTIPIGSGWSVYWYGIIIALGFSLAVLYAFRTAPKLNINKDKLLDAVIITTPVSILCARAYYLIFDGVKLNSIGEFFGFSGAGFSGLAIYGAVIGAAVCAVIFTLLFKFHLPSLLDLMSVAFLIGQGIGRWGNFVNQEAFGCATGSTWFGMTSENVCCELGDGALAHPCFLYESIWCIAGFFILNKIIHNRKFAGQAACTYGVWYGFGRAIIETLRTDSLMIGKIKVSCLLSALVCVVCIALLIVLNKKHSENNTGEYTSVFSELNEKDNEEEINQNENN